MCIASVAAQVANESVVVLLPAIIGHESTVVAVDVGISSGTIGMVVQLFDGTAVHASFCHILRRKPGFIRSK